MRTGVRGILPDATVAHGEGGGKNRFPCTSTELRAGALLPELAPDPQLLADDHIIWKDPQTGQFLLAFSAGIMNLGVGKLNVVGYRDPVAGAIPDPNTMPAYQRIFHPDGTCDELLVGTMTYHDEHHHWHLDGVMTYELLDADKHLVKPNTKVAFCMADVPKVDPPLPGFPKAPAYNGCDPNRSSTYVNTGTSVGWADVYDKMLIGQNFDVTDLMNQPPDWYFIRQTVDVAGILVEEDKTNNTTGIWVRLGIGVPYSIGGPSREYRAPRAHDVTPGTAAGAAPVRASAGAANPSPVGADSGQLRRDRTSDVQQTECHAPAGR